MRWSQQQSFQILRPLLSGLCYLVQCIKCIKWIKWIKCIQWKETRHDSMYLDMIFELPWTEPYGTTDWRCLICFGQRLFHKHWGAPRNKNHSKKARKGSSDKRSGIHMDSLGTLCQILTSRLYQLHQLFVFENLCNSFCTKHLSITTLQRGAASFNSNKAAAVSPLQRNQNQNIGEYHEAQTKWQMTWNMMRSKYA